MSIIDRIELYFVRMPLPAPIKLAWIPGYEGEATQHYIIRLVTDDGVEGWSAMSAGTLERAGMGDSYCNMLMGIDATDIDLVTERIKVMASTGNNEMWIEPAFWDIKGKLAGKPVYELLGGKAEPVELYASSGDVKEPEARIEEAWARYEEGFRTFKIRVHDFDEAVDIRQIQETARALEGKMKIAVDCNQPSGSPMSAPGQSGILPAPNALPMPAPRSVPPGLKSPSIWIALRIWWSSTIIRQRFPFPAVSCTHAALQK